MHRFESDSYVRTLFKNFYLRVAQLIFQCLPSLRMLPKTILAHLLMCSLIYENRTMVSLRRLRNLYRLCSNPLLPGGSFVECGVARGGCIAIMSFASLGKRPVWGFDSFEGMPELTEEDEGHGQADVGLRCAGPNGLHEAQTTLKRSHVSGDWVTLVPGWFEDTLHKYILRVEPIAALRLDNDWYKSTKYCLDILYDRVVAGGLIIIDDYHTYTGCRKAVDEFRSKRRIKSPLITTESGSEIYWSKSLLSGCLLGILI